MKIFISSGNQGSRHYKQAMNLLKKKLFEMRFEVTTDVKELPLVDCAYFIDGWLQDEQCRFECGLCCLLGKYTLFQTVSKSHKEYSKTLPLQYAIKNGLGFTLEDLRSPSRERDKVYARYLFAWYCHVHLRMEFVQIGKYLKRTHATVMYYVESIRYVLHKDIDFTFMYQCMMRHLVELKAKELGCTQTHEIGANHLGVLFKPEDDSPHGNTPKFIICRHDGIIRAATDSECIEIENEPLKQEYDW